MSRTNLTSDNVHVSRELLGEGAFRLAYAGTYLGGQRNSQMAACKCFKSMWAGMEREYFHMDFKVADTAIWLAKEWNAFCPAHVDILVSRGSLHSVGGRTYLVEPFIRYFTKFTSNNGWIADEDDEGWPVLAMEAFAHFSYHRTGGQKLVCDLQGRYRNDRRYRNGKCRFELSDPAICSRRREYGPTDMGEKGIESFFANHRCNRFCDERWQRPRAPRQWFETSSATSMLASTHASRLRLHDTTVFNPTIPTIQEDSDSSDY